MSQSMLQTPPGETNDQPLAAGAWLVLLAAFLGWMFDGLEMGIVPLVARPALRQLLGGAGDDAIGPWMGYITASFLLGAAAGGVVFGWLGDRIGRVKSMAWSVLCYSAFTALGYFATHAWHLLALRFIAALGMGGEWALGVALVMESWPQARRPLMAGIIGVASNLGFTLIALLGLVFRVTEQSWRVVMLAGVIPALLTFFIRLFVPESHKWRLAQAQQGPARPLADVFSPPLLSATLLGIGLASVALIGTWGSVQWIPLWVDQLTGGKIPGAKAMSQVASSLGAVVGSLLGALVAGRMGRRPTYFVLCLVSLLLCAGLFRGFHAYGPGLLGMIFLVGASTAAFYGWLPLYLPEIFPTRARATGQGIGYNAGRVFAAVGAIEAGALVRTCNGSYARSGALITLVYLIGLFLIWAGPETRGKALPE